MSLFEEGQLQKSQQLAHDARALLPRNQLEWRTRFASVEARAAAWRGLDEDALAALSFAQQDNVSAAASIERDALLGLVFSHLHQFEKAEQLIAQAQSRCSASGPATCGEVMRARASLAIQRGDNAEAFRLYSENLAWEKRFGDRFQQAAALMNLGGTSLYQEHYDAAIDVLRESDEIATALNAGDILVNNLGNLGWAYYKLGEADRGLKLFQQAESRALDLGDFDDAIVWLSTAGHVYQDEHDLPRAFEAHHRAFELAQRIGNREDTVDTLEDLAYVSIESGRLADAAGFLSQLDPFVRASGNRLDLLAVTLARGRLAAARHSYAEAEATFEKVVADKDSQTSMRLDALHELALLSEAEGNAAVAEKRYRAALETFESARDQLQNEDSKLPFLANATGIYDDYIRFLIANGKSPEALALADRSRARTLEQGLGVSGQAAGMQAGVLDATRVARQSKATLLFYWLGERKSYLWAASPAKVNLYELPPRAEITRLVNRYRQALLGPEDTFDATAQSGEQLYRMLVGPAVAMIAPGADLIVLGDGPLNQLNFETLVVPGPKPHFFIEDAALTEAPSMSLLMASAQRPGGAGSRILLIGDAQAPDPHYPALPMADQEMAGVESHFAPADRTVMRQGTATPGSYVASAPGQYAYIHFVAHGTASSSDPLESAIVLSPDSAAEGSPFKLYARQIMQHPLRARLVTISACYGSGDRSYAGEGLVGLSWAFLRAGAHNVIGALWEVSDESTPRLMDAMYRGLAAGETPGHALREAKLSLLHSQTGFRRPFYWAPFQLYAGL